MKTESERLPVQVKVICKIPLLATHFKNNELSSALKGSDFCRVQQ
jgi:hypothetical protein